MSPGSVIAPPLSNRTPLASSQSGSSSTSDLFAPLDWTGTWNRLEPKYHDESYPPGMITIIECWTYHGSQSNHCEIRQVGESLIYPWLHQPPPTKNEAPPTGGLKVIHATYLSSSVPLKQSSFTAIKQAFGLPSIEFYPPSLSGGCGMFFSDEKDYVFVCRMPIFVGTTNCFIVYDPEADITRGVLFAGPHLGTSEALSRIQSQYLACSHPLLLPVLMVEEVLSYTSSRLQGIHGVLLDIEEQTGFGDIEPTGVRDYQNLVRSLGKQNCVFAYIQTVLRSTRLHLGFLRRKLQHLETNLPDMCKQKLKRHSVSLHERMEFLESSIEHILMYNGIEMRLEAQKTVLFNLIAQADNQINIGLAKDSRELAAASKQDSSAMKIIAVLTTLFLPGTFVATVFAMPLFNWSEPSVTNIATQHHWVYWAVTGPLTVVTMIIVISWALWRGRQNRLLHWSARESVRVDSSPRGIYGAERWGEEGHGGNAQSSRFEKLSRVRQRRQKSRPEFPRHDESMEMQ